jgi:peptidoglycan LD-endopeptidase LytH
MRLFIIAIFLMLFAACNPIKSVKEAFVSTSPYERYLKNLESANLQDRPMVKQWIEAGLRAMNDSVHVSLPFSETGHFLSHKPEARSYRFDARDGQVLSVNGATTATGDTKIFLDLFIWKNDSWKHQASSDSSLTLSHEFKRNSKCLLRIQPELLVNAYYSVAVSLTPVLINPVSGASNKSIQSFYGDSREGGKRSHEGVDIFAKKGTPVVAPTHGVISRVGTSRLGGKVVWMFDKKREHSYYFAHLDSQYVQPGMVVKQGDTLGVVGNTGNARFTPPHLHFGIYQSKSKDPLHYIKTLESVVITSPIDTSFKVNTFKVTKAKQPVRSGPGENQVVIAELDKDSFVRVVAQSNDWFRISLPDYVEGYVSKTAVAPAHPGKTHVLERETLLLAEASLESVIVDYLNQNTPVELLAQFGPYHYVKTGEGIEGWISL